MNRSSDRARRREQPEPEEGVRPVPKAVLALVAGLLVWGTGYIAWHAGWPLTGGDRRTPVAAAGGEGVSGREIFANNCASCHQADGRGIPGTFPPLADSEWVTEDARVPVAIVHDGLRGPIEVAGDTYRGSMPAFRDQLSEAEIAAVVTHVRESWSNDAAPVDADTVAGHAERFGERKAWTAETLRAELNAPQP